jgi:hypothetical protein
MNAPSASVLLKCLAIAGLLILSSCASFGKPATALTQRSESVCDQAPPSPIPPIPDSQPAIFVAFNNLMALYMAEVTKYRSGQSCREKVRAENIKAAN